MGPFGPDDPAQGLAVQHGYAVPAMGHLHGRGVFVAVHCDDFHAQTLKLQGHFLAQFARAEHEHSGGRRRKRSSDTDHHTPRFSGYGPLVFRAAFLDQRQLAS